MEFLKGANGKKKPKPFACTDRCQGAFDDPAAATLDTDKLLANMHFNEEIFFPCDSSQFGAGAVLFQHNDEGQEEVPIAYASRKYTLAERNYCTFQQEAGAVVWALEKFACFFQGHPVRDRCLFATTQALLTPKHLTWKRAWWH